MLPEVARIVEALAVCDAALVALDGRGLDTEQMLEMSPELRAMEAQYPGAIEALVGAVHGDARSTAILEGMTTWPTNQTRQ